MTTRIFRLAFLIALSNSLVRINIWHDYLKDMCVLRGGSLYEELLNNQQNLSLHLINFYSRNSEYSVQMEKCQNDVNSKAKLQLFIDSVQFCMEEQKRMLEDQKNIFVNRLLEVLCELFLMGGGKVDEHCMNITEVNFSACRQEFKEFPMILLPLIYNTEECSEARKILDCFENGIQDCNETTRDEFEAANNVTFYTLYGCPYIEHVYEAPRFDGNDILNEKVEADNKPSVRFNFTVIESSNNSEEDSRSVDENHPVVRFNFTKTNLREKCIEKGEEFTKSVENSYSKFLSVKSIKQFSITSLVEVQNLTRKKDLEAVMKEHCYQDSDIRNILEQIFDAVEQCLDEEDWLEIDKKEALLNRSIDKFCSELETTDSLFPIDQECFHDSATSYQLALCSRNISVEEFYFHSLPLLFISSPEECNNLYWFQNCKLNVHGDCKSSTKNWLQEQYNAERRFIGCEDVMYEISTND